MPGCCREQARGTEQRSRSSRRMLAAGWLRVRKGHTALRPPIRSQTPFTNQFQTSAGGRRVKPRGRHRRGPEGSARSGTRQTSKGTRLQRPRSVGRSTNGASPQSRPSGLPRRGGHEPVGIERPLSESRQSQQDWRVILREFVAAARPSDYHWTPPNRRYIASGLCPPSVER
jgi:hypothetical protein